MYKFKYNKLVITLIHDSNKIQTGISLVHYLVFLVVDEIAHLGLTSDHQLIDLRLLYASTYFRNRCFYCWDMFDEYHFVRRERPCLLIRKKQWIISICVYLNYTTGLYCKLSDSYYRSNFIKIIVEWGQFWHWSLISPIFFII